MMEHIFPTYKQYPIDIVDGHGWYLIDQNQKQYMDFTSGIGVCGMGYDNEVIQTNVANQLAKIWHTSNLYQSHLVEEVAELLVQSDQLVFFCNSGTEANEAALKLARKATGRKKVLAFNNGFHGRTYGSMSMTGNPDIRVGFAPLVPEIELVNYNNQAALDQIDQTVAGVILEVIQGEGGVVEADNKWLHQVEEKCHEMGTLLIIDEVQTGIGRTGKKFAYEWFGLDPDIITTAKGLGNGIPVGAMIGKSNLGEFFGPGTHGTTFGGNKLAMAAAKGVLEQLTPSFLEEVQQKSEKFWHHLKNEILPLPNVENISGKGLMVGIQLNEKIDVNQVISQLQARGLLTLSAKHNTLRLLPPLIISEEALNKGLNLIKILLIELEGELK